MITVSGGAAITTQPLSQHVTAGTAVTLTAAASGAGLTYQWKKNGAPIAGATSASYVIASAQLGDMGFYACTITNSTSSTDLATATLTAAAGAAARPVNVSTRAPVTTAEPLTAGFVLSAPKTLLIRASVPALTPFGVPACCPIRRSRSSRSAGAWWWRRTTTGRRRRISRRSRRR